MPQQHGDFIWYELLTPDAAAAASFYAAVTGWGIRPAEGSPRGYQIISAGGSDVAGLMARPGMPAKWLGYVGVDDVDSTVDGIVRSGGAEHVPPADIPGIGRFALVADPQGAMFSVMRAVSEGTSLSFSPTSRGHCHWNELMTSDPAAALAFYIGGFGWEKGDAMPMGEMGDYQFINHHGAMLGAVMKGRPGGPPPSWTFYFGVADIDIAAETVTGQGGALHYGPAEVPGGIFAVVASDPQGGMFGLVGPRQRP